MSDVAKALKDRRLNVWNQAKEIADRAANENRNMTAEEDESFTRATTEIDALDRRMKSIIEGEQRAKDLEESFNSLSGKKTDEGERRNAGTGQREEGERLDDRNEELRKFMTGEGPSYFEVKPTKGTDMRTLTVGTATAGGNTVPTDFYNRLVEHLIQVSAVLQAKPTVLNTAAGENIQIPKTTSHPVGGLVAEGASIAAVTTDPAFGQVTLGAYKYGALIQISRELLTDTGVDLEGYLARAAGRALGNAMGTDFILGNGTNKPDGVVPKSSLGVTGAASVAGAFNADNLIDLYYSVIPQYRNSSSCYWMMNDTTVAAVRKLKDSQNRYMWEPSIQLGVPDTLLGKPVVTDYNVANVALAAKSILFGDFSTYFIRFAGGARFERSDEYAFNTDLVTFRALMRADADLVDLTGSVKHFIGNAA